MDVSPAHSYAKSKILTIPIELSIYQGSLKSGNKKPLRFISLNMILHIHYSWVKYLVMFECLVQVPSSPAINLPATCPVSLLALEEPQDEIRALCHHRQGGEKPTISNCTLQAIYSEFPWGFPWGKTWCLKNRVWQHFFRRKLVSTCFNCSIAGFEIVNC